MRSDSHSIARDGDGAAGAAGDRQQDEPAILDLGVAGIGIAHGQTRRYGSGTRAYPRQTCQKKRAAARGAAAR